jgi:hypothetical protein
LAVYRHLVSNPELLVVGKEKNLFTEF